MKKIISTLLNKKPNPQGLYWILGFFVSMTVVTILAWSKDNLYDWAANHQNIFVDHQYWRILTSVLIHSDPEHWLSNSLLLIVFGWLLAGYFGSVVFPLATLALSWLTHLMTLWTYPNEVYLIGASGLVYVMAGFWLINYFFIARERSWRSRLIRFLGVCISLLLPTQFQPHVSYRAHLFGFIFGLLGGLIYYFLNRKWIQDQDVWIEDLDENSIDQAAESTKELNF